MPSTAFAQVGPGQVPAQLVPGRQRQPTPAAPQSTTESGVTTHIETQNKPANSDDITFVLEDIHIDGAHAVSPAQLEPIWARYRGKTITIGKLYDIANAITQYYADKGYALSFSFIPEQEIADNVVTIRVVEGFVSHVTFTGETQDIPQIVRDMADRITQSRPLQNKDLERYLLLINDIPGITAQATLTASAKTENASEVIINLRRKAFGVSVTGDNHLARTLGYWNGGINGSANSVIRDGDTVQLDQRCGLFCNVYNQTSVNWITPIGSEGVKFGINALESNERPETGILVPLDFTGESKTLAFDLSYPVLRSRDTNTSIGATASISDSKTHIFAGTLTRDKVRNIDLHANHDFIDKTGATNTIRINATQGLPLLGSTDEDDPLRSRSFGDGTFLTAGAYLSRVQPLDKWSPYLANTNLVASLNGQYSLSGALLSVTQCYYGGDAFGRGYESGAFSGDNCVLGSLELQHSVAIKSIILQIYGFGDTGYVWRDGLLTPGESRTENGKSVGTGIRFFLTQHIQSQFELAWPLNSDLTANGKDDPRALFSFAVTF